MKTYSYVAAVERKNKRGSQIGAPEPSGAVVVLTILPPGRIMRAWRPDAEFVLVTTDVDLFPPDES